MTPKVYLFLNMEFDNICFAYNVLWVREFIAATAKCVTFTDDLEIQGHMIFQVYLCFYACSLEYLDIGAHNASVIFFHQYPEWVNSANTNQKDTRKAFIL